MLESLLQRLSCNPVTPEKKLGLQLQPSQDQHVTRVTPVTPEKQKGSAELWVQAWTPAGVACLVLANDSQHADFIKKMNPPPPMYRRCDDCIHAQFSVHHPALCKCGMGIDAGTATGLWWRHDAHLCSSFSGVTRVTGVTKC